MRLVTLLIVLLALIALCLIFGRGVRDNFLPGESIQVSWAPSSPFPQNLAYNWGVCISQPTPGGNRGGLCSAQTPPYPPGTPGPGWQNKGQTTQGQTTLALNNANCFNCALGQILILQLQAVDLANPTHPTSGWGVFSIDLSSKSTVVRNAITDSTMSSQPLYPGSTGLLYTLQLNQPGFAAGNEAHLSIQVVRAGVPAPYVYSSTVPFTTESPDGTTGTYTGSFTTVGPNSPWSPSAPGPLQPGDVVTVISEVFNPGSAQASGSVFFSGTVSQTATMIFPSTPTGVIWNLNS